MFCSKCGTKRITNGNFCHNCGQSFVSNVESCGSQHSQQAESSNSVASTVTKTIGQKTSASTVSFKEFMKRKETDRQNKFEPKKKKIKVSEKIPEVEVSINVGYMKLDNDGINLKKCRGKTLPIKVSSFAGRNEILEKSVRKHANHDKNILGELEHVLLNGDGNGIITLPGTNDEFVLSKYKEDIGKNYNRITLYIALK